MQKEKETKVISPEKTFKKKITVDKKTVKDLFDINVTAKSLSKKKVEKKPKKEKNPMMLSDDEEDVEMNDK